MNKTEIWDRLSTTPASATSPYVTLGGQMLTAVDPIYRARKLTEEFGPVGVGWGWDVMREWVEDFGGTKYVFAKVQVWYIEPTGEPTIRYFGPQIGGAPSVDPSESFKSAITDAIGKCFSMLGLAADVYAGGHTTAKPVATDGRMATILKAALKKHAEGTKEEIQDAIEKVRRSEHYTGIEKEAVIAALSTGDTAG